MYRRAFAIGLPCLVLTFLLHGPLPAAAADWEEFGIPAGGRVRVVGEMSPGQAMVGLYVPAGTSARPDRPQLARLGPLAFLGAQGLSGDGDLHASLVERGWTLRQRCDLDGAGFVLAGPSSELEAVLERVLARLERPGELAARDLDRAWRGLEADWLRWSNREEVRLRQDIAALHHGDHPFRAGLAQLRPEGAVPPPLAELREFVDNYYQAGAMVLLVAGDFDADLWQERWRPRLEALPGRLLPPPPKAAPGRGGGELRLPSDDGNLMILQFPAPAGGVEDAAAAAVLAGVLTQRLRLDIMERGLARGASAWFDFTSPGPSPLEIQLRGFDPQGLEPLQALLERIIDRMRKGQFSEYQVISAKDIILGRMDAATSGGAPRGDSLLALSVWGEQLLRQTLYFDRWRLTFENRLLDTGIAEVSAIARRLLRSERGTLGLLIPEGQLE